MKEMIRNVFISAALLLALAFPSGPALAQCENPASASNSMSQLVRDDIGYINDWINQEWNFLDEDLTNTATNEVANRMDEFDENIIAALNRWWSEYLPAMKDMTKQWNVSQIDQTVALGEVVSSQMQAEARLAMQEREIDARRSFGVAEGTCQLDSLGTGAVRAKRVARALTRSYAAENSDRLNNRIGTPGASGTGADLRSRWEEYVTYFCDPARGDQGCTTPGTLAGSNTNIPYLLFGERQTIDVSNADNRRINQASLRTLVTPWTWDPLPPTVVEVATGQQEILNRRARTARMNTVYNAVGQLLSERTGGSGTDTSPVRTAGGVHISMASTNASYKEISEALGRARFYNPQYITRLIDEPEQLVREMGAIKAVQMQQMNDLYRRAEEMLYLETATVAAKLDERKPDNGASNMPQR